MFNKTLHLHPVYNNEPSHVTVTEKRAPTDDSVRLLKEMEEAAQQKVMDSIAVKNTTFECKIVRMRDSISAQDIFLVYYKLNGQKGKTEVKIDDYSNMTTHDIVFHIRDHVASDIANKMITSAFTELLIHDEYFGR